MTTEELARIAKLLALIQQGAIELLTFINNKRQQEGKTALEIAEHAEESNAEAKKLIEAL